MLFFFFPSAAALTNLFSISRKAFKIKKNLI